MPKIFTQHEKDAEFGKRTEAKVRPLLNEFYDLKLVKGDEDNCVLDFVDREKKVFMELKGRRIEHNKHPTTQIGYNKVVEGKRRILDGYQVFFIFSFTDYICAFELELRNIPQNWVKDASRGKERPKPHAFIPISKLKKIYRKKTNGPYCTLT
jgi:hypothetical protein